MVYQDVDSNRTPPRGLSAGDYDVIIASNVIHATADLRQTLERVRRLLVPGGLLVMLEVTAPQRWFDLTVGLTEGWWAYTDHDLRTNIRRCAAAVAQSRWMSRDLQQRRASERQGRSAVAAVAVVARTQRASRSWWLVPDRGGVAEALGPSPLAG